MKKFWFLLLLVPFVAGANGNGHHHGTDYNQNFNQLDVAGNKTRVFGFGTSFPNLEGCIGGEQYLFGLFGRHRVDTSCWMQQLVKSEKNLDLRARLKCADRAYRNAIAYNKSWWKYRSRRNACISYVSAIWILEQQKEREALLKCKEEKAVCTYVNGVLELKYE